MKIVLHADGLPKQILAAADLKDASSKMRSFIELNGLGTSDLIGKCGDVLEGKTLIATISYNGRVWDTNGKEVI